MVAVAILASSSSVPIEWSNAIVEHGLLHHDFIVSAGIGHRVFDLEYACVTVPVLFLSWFVVLVSVSVCICCSCCSCSVFSDGIQSLFSCQQLMLLLMMMIVLAHSLFAVALAAAADSSIRSFAFLVCPHPSIHFIFLCSPSFITSLITLSDCATGLIVKHVLAFTALDFWLLRAFVLWYSFRLQAARSHYRDVDEAFMQAQDQTQQLQQQQEQEQEQQEEGDDDVQQQQQEQQQQQQPEEKEMRRTCSGDWAMKGQNKQSKHVKVLIMSKAQGKNPQQQHQHQQPQPRLHTS